MQVPFATQTVDLCDRRFVPATLMTSTVQFAARASAKTRSRSPCVDNQRASHFHISSRRSRRRARPRKSSQLVGASAIRKMKINDVCSNRTLPQPCAVLCALAFSKSLSFCNNRSISKTEMFTHTHKPRTRTGHCSTGSLANMFGPAFWRSSNSKHFSLCLGFFGRIMFSACPESKLHSPMIPECFGRWQRFGQSSSPASRERGGSGPLSLPARRRSAPLGMVSPVLPSSAL